MAASEANLEANLCSTPLGSRVYTSTYPIPSIIFPSIWTVNCAFLFLIFFKPIFTIIMYSVLPEFTNKLVFETSNELSVLKLEGKFF